MLTVLVLMCLLVLPASSVIECEKHLWRRQSALNLYFRLVRQSVTCSIAFKTCKGFGGQALIIPDTKTAEAVESYLRLVPRKLPSEINYRLFIGLSNTDDGLHKWVDGTPLKGHYSNWDTHAFPFTAGCAVTNACDGKWLQVPTGNFRWFLCQAIEPCLSDTSLSVTGAEDLGNNAVWPKDSDSLEIRCSARGKTYDVTKVSLTCEGDQPLQGDAESLIVVSLSVTMATPSKNCKCSSSYSGGYTKTREVTIYSVQRGLEILSKRLLDDVDQLIKRKKYFSHKKLIHISHNIHEYLTHSNSITVKTGKNIMNVISKITNCCTHSVDIGVRREFIEYIGYVEAGIQLIGNEPLEFIMNNVELSVYPASKYRSSSIHSIVFCDMSSPKRNQLFELKDEEAAMPCNENKTVTSVKIPLKSIMDSLSDEKKEAFERLSVTLYDKSYAATPRTKRGKSLNIISKVISVELQGIRPVLNEMVTFSFRPTNQDTASSLKLKCFFWNSDDHDGHSVWDDEGCSLVERGQGLVTCDCSHLSTFALMVVVDNDAWDKHNHALTTFGCTISVVSLLVTLWMYSKLPYRVAKDTSVRIMMNICANLLVSNILIITTSFVIYIPDNNSGSIFCKLLAMSLHYFLLCAFVWISCDAYYLSISIVDDFDEKAPKKYKIVFTLASLFLPMTVVLVTGATPPLDNYNFIDHNNKCWIESPAVFYAFVIPAGLLMLFNCAMFLVVFRYAQHVSDDNYTFCPIKQVIMKKLKGSITLIFLLSLTWIFGPFGIGPEKVVFEYFFVVLNIFQGCFIFALFWIRRPDVGTVCDEASIDCEEWTLEPQHNCTTKRMSSSLLQTMAYNLDHESLSSLGKAKKSSTTIL